jgi:hypothetical protein
LLRPDPVERAEELLNSGKVNEALKFSADVSEALRRTLYDLTQLQIRTHLGLFKTAVRSQTMKDAREHFRQVELLSKTGKLKDAAVEERYFQGMFATVTAPGGVNRKARHMTLVEHVRQIAGLQGDIVECGCFRGLSSWMICRTLHDEYGPFDGTGFHIYDSFEGLSAPAEEDVLGPNVKDRERLATMMMPGRFTCSEVEVRQNMAAFPGIRYHPGWLPQSLEGEEERRYRFVHVDVDLYEPTKGALEYFYPRLVPGGIILSDDYGWPGGQKAFDEFCEQHQVPLEKLTNNQAVLRKV